MALQVEVISRETIRPSLPTPPHLKDFKLSHADQYIPPIHVPVILFYPAKVDDGKFKNVKAVDRLKTSLSETLTRFYPLAGRINDNQLLECKDTGVEYVETQVGGELNLVVDSPKKDDLVQLIPCNLRTAAMGSAPLLAVQVSKFGCGGISIAVCGSHKTVDAATLCTFVNSWAKTALGTCEKVVFPSFDAARIFPARQVASLVLPTGGSLNKVVNRRFIFTSSKIFALKAKASNPSYVSNPTRVEAISALLWRCALKVCKAQAGSLKPSLVNLGVNLRGKLTPPLPDYSFGNLLMGAITPATSGDDIDLHCLVGKLREGKRILDEDCLKKLPVDDVLAMCHESMREKHIQYAKGEVEFYTVASWSRFPFYEADFGWGKPIWTTAVNAFFKNIIMLMDSKTGDGIEAWVSLVETEMEMFEHEAELLAYARPA